MSAFEPTIKGRHKGAYGRKFCMYSVYDNRTDFPIVIDAPAEECAKALNRSVNSFFCLVSRVQNGKIKRYTVLRRFVDEEDEENGET